MCFIYLLTNIPIEFLPMQQRKTTNKELDLSAVIDLTETVSKDLQIVCYQQIYQNKTKMSDYKILSNLAKGGFGEVFVGVKEKDLIQNNNTKVVYAIKRISKDMCKRNKNTAFFMSEREIMTSLDTTWVVKAHECLQDDCYLYFIMDFIPGGDLLGYLSKTDTIGPEEVKFYAAEILLALDFIHEKGYVHRDLKPDNVFIAEDGHIKLGDFGSSGKMENGIITSKVPIGTPDYVCKDVLEVGENGLASYTQSVDLWTLGVIIHEMASGVPPFYAESLRETYRKIQEIDYERLDDPDLNDLLENLLCNRDKRFTSEQIKKHKFFEGIDWERIREMTPPFIPEIKDKEDVSHFANMTFKPETSTIKGGYKDFIGFTYDPKYVRTFGETMTKRMMEQGEQLVADSAKFLSGAQLTNQTKNAFEQSLSQDNLYNEETVNQLKKQIEEFDEKLKNKEVELDDLITTKMLEIDDLNLTISDLECERENKTDEVTKQSNSLKHFDLSLANKREELRVIIDEIINKKEDLENVQKDIKTKTELKLSADQTSYLKDLIYDIKTSLERSKFNTRLADIKKGFYFFYKEHEDMRKQLMISREIVDDDNLADLKKTIRSYKTEIKDYQQRIEIEENARIRLETENKRLQEQLSSNTVCFTNKFSVKNALNNNLIQITVENNQMIFNDKRSDIGLIYVRDLRNGEYHHLDYKKRSLTVIVHFLKEFTHSLHSSSFTRKSAAAIEKELDTEKVLLSGLEELEYIIDGASLKDVQRQKQGSIKKIEKLMKELKIAKSQTGHSSCSESNCIDSNIISVNTVEFNNHIFREHTVGKGTLCDHCGDLMYGLLNQSYHCPDCLLTVHKECYILVETSCEMQQAINKGTFVPVTMNNIEEKERILRVVKS